MTFPDEDGDSGRIPSIIGKGLTLQRPK